MIILILNLYKGKMTKIIIVKKLFLQKMMLLMINICNKSLKMNKMIYQNKKN